MRTRFAELYGADSAARAVLARAPGRVNLIGEHTDYNEGFVFPMAIDFSVRVMGAARNDETVRVHAMDLQADALFSLKEEARSEVPVWSDYVRGVLLAVRAEHGGLCGMDLLVAGDVPRGAGLSSSAALEIATAMLAQELWGIKTEPLSTVRLCQRVEHDFIGVNCGIMDQYVSCLGRAGQALLLDCRALTHVLYPLPGTSARVVVVDTGVKHSLAGSAYNQRRADCERGVESLRQHDARIRALRDVTPDMLDRYEAELAPAVARRCRHVVAENGRTLAAAQALSTGDLAGFGRLMYASHESLRDLYEVSCEELDLLVALARPLPGVYGARMTGGGFGGCTVNLVRPEDVEGFIARIKSGYAGKTGREPRVFICGAGAGAEIVREKPEAFI